MPITVPPVPGGLHPAGCWRKLLTGLNTDPQAVGGYRALGPLLSAGDTVELPDGALVLTVDKATRGWEDNHRSYGRHAVEDATVTVYLASGGTLAETWSKQYISSKSAFGATTMKKLAALLDKHPAAPDAAVTVLREARRPNSKEGRCRWCHYMLPAGTGHVAGHGRDAEVEHYEDCPAAVAKTGEVCAVCGVTVVSYQAARHYRRDAEGGTEVRHKPVDGESCWERPVASAQEQADAQEELARAERERNAAARAEQKKKDDAKARRAADKTAKKRAAHDAEQARVAGLKTVSRATTTPFDKGLGDGMRCCMREHADTLEDGTTTLRWTVETYGGGSGFNGEDYDPDEGVSEPFTDKESARSHYRTLRFEPGRRQTRTDSRTGGGACWECSRGGATVPRSDSSGIRGMVCPRCDRENPDDYMLSFA